MIQLTDAEQAFADSPKGRHDVALAAAKHRMSEAHRGAQAQPWTDAMATEAARRAAAQQARQNLQIADMAARAPALESEARAARDTVAAMRDERLRNAYKRQG